MLVVAAGCNGDDETSPTTAPPPSRDTTFVTTTIPEAVATTSPTPPTTVPDTAPPTTAPPPDPTTTVGDTQSTTTAVGTIPDPEVQAVVDAARASWSAYLEAIRDPGNEDRILALADTKRDEALASAVGIVQELIASNQRAVANPDTPTEFVPRTDSVEIDGQSAIIEYCWIGSDVIVEVGGNSDGSDRIVDDDILIFVERESFEIIDGQWRKVGGTVLQQIEGETSCDSFV